MSRIYRFYDHVYKPARPKEVKGGIKAQSKGGQFTKKWWSKRWIQTLESFDIGARLSRGRSYARKGQVADLYITKDGVSAKNTHINAISPSNTAAVINIQVLDSSFLAVGLFGSTSCVSIFLFIIYLPPFISFLEFLTRPYSQCIVASLY